MGEPRANTDLDIFSGATGVDAANYTQCVGYRKPLFLGGQMKYATWISDLDVYWHSVGQAAGTSGLD